MNLKHTNKFENDILEIENILLNANALVIGIGSGLTACDNIGYSGKRFKEHFFDFIQEYNFLDMLQASLYHFESWSRYWAFHSRFTVVNYFDLKPTETFLKLNQIIKNKNYFIITTNSDSSLYVNGFDESKIFYVQGKYNMLQCSKMCSNDLYQKDELLYEMYKTQTNLEVEYDLIPKCEKCNAFLEINKRIAYKGMVEDKNFLIQKQKYLSFINENKNIVFWEIGVGYTTPQLIKWPFWEWTLENKNNIYLVFNQKNYRMSKELISQSKIYNYDIAKIIKNINV